MKLKNINKAKEAVAFSVCSECGVDLYPSTFEELERFDRELANLTDNEASHGHYREYRGSDGTDSWVVRIHMPR